MQLKNDGVLTPPGFNPERSPWLELASTEGAKARFFKFRIGEIECISLSDGGIPFPKPNALSNAAAHSSDIPELMLIGLSCLLVRVPHTGKLVLIDAGFGPIPKLRGEPLPTAGRLLASMADAGVAAEEIDVVLASHLHPDHVDGMYNDGLKVFPNADYYAGAEEVAFWSQQNVDLSKSPVPDAVKQEMLDASQRFIKAAGGDVTLFSAGEEVIAGIGTMLVPGHTPNQIAFILSSRDEKLLYTADAFDLPTGVQKPHQHGPMDLDPELAVQTRRSLVELLSEPGWHSFTPHFPWPSVGTIRKEADASVWRPDL